jgi:2-dehydro-3-deoxyphosphogluconate aldolase / (4S)-4-hydroxy-2-oxoglutarate aldolase
VNATEASAAGAGEPTVSATDRLLATLREDRVLIVVRAAGVPDPRGLADTAALCGIRVVEVSLTTGGALDAIRRIAGDASLTVGAGTVLTADDARGSIDAGAQYLVTPTVLPDVAEVAHANGIPILVGAFTPTEVLAAHRLGAAAVKVFPARAVGPSYVRDLAGPLPDVPLVPSGGVDHANAAAFLDAGALAVSVGGSGVRASAVEAGDHRAIEGSLRELVAAIARHVR